MDSEIVFIVGHTKRHPGARSYSGIPEHTFNRSLSELLYAIDDRVTIAHHYHENDRMSALQLSHYLPKNAWKIMLHYNSATVPAQGAEALVYGNDYKVTCTAEMLLSEWCARHGMRNRGVKVRSRDGERGQVFLKELHRCIIWEPFFTHQKDEISARFFDNPTHGVDLCYRFWREVIKNGQL